MLYARHHDRLSIQVVYAIELAVWWDNQKPKPCKLNVILQTWEELQRKAHSVSESFRDWSKSKSQGRVLKQSTEEKNQLNK